MSCARVKIIRIVPDIVDRSQRELLKPCAMQRMVFDDFKRDVLELDPLRIGALRSLVVIDDSAPLADLFVKDGKTEKEGNANAREKKPYSWIVDRRFEAVFFYLESEPDQSAKHPTKKRRPGKG